MPLFFRPRHTPYLIHMNRVKKMKGFENIEDERERESLIYANLGFYRLIFIALGLKTALIYKKLRGNLSATSFPLLRNDNLGNK